MTEKTIITKPDSAGRKLRDARAAVNMARGRGLSIDKAVRTVATAGGWIDNTDRIAEVLDIARPLV